MLTTVKALILHHFCRFTECRIITVVSNCTDRIGSFKLNLAQVTTKRQILSKISD